MSEKNEFPAVVVVDGDMASHNWILEKEEMVLGREDSCDMVIPMRQVSRQHVVFRRVGEDQYEVEDLGSKNGSWLNGNRFEGTRQINDGDEVHLALKVRLRFVGSGITAPVTGNIPDVIPSRGGRGRLKIDIESRQLFIGGEELDPPLSLPQYRLLELLYINDGGVVSREEVVEAVWPEAMGEGVSEQAIDALVRRLRDRLNEADPETQYVVTVRGHGFRLENPQS